MKDNPLADKLKEYRDARRAKAFAYFGGILFLICSGLTFAIYVLNYTIEHGYWK